MSRHEFMIEVEVIQEQSEESVHKNDWGDRSESDYATAALQAAGWLRDGRQLDGFADLSVRAYISDVMRLS